MIILINYRSYKHIVTGDFIPKISKEEKEFKAHFKKYNYELGAALEKIGKMEGLLEGIHEKITALPCEKEIERIGKLENAISEQKGINSVWDKFKWHILTLIIGGVAGYLAHIV